MKNLVVQGVAFSVTTEPDADAGTPWDRECGHGPVRENRHPELSKRAGERVLKGSGRGPSLLYDFAGAVEIARREGWGLTAAEDATLAARLGRTPTRGDTAAEAARLDFERLKAWCNDEWGYAGVIVTAPDGATDSVWGVESDSDNDYTEELARGLAEPMAAKFTEEQKQQAANAERMARALAILEREERKAATASATARRLHDALDAIQEAGVFTSLDAHVLRIIADDLEQDAADAEDADPSSRGGA